MHLSPVIKNLIAPNSTTLLYAFKGVLAVAVALSVAFYLQLERPFWAVVAAMMLQGRPQMGLVIEKSIILVTATVCGGLLAFFILEPFIHHPTLIIAALAGIAFTCTYYGSAHRHVNYSYGFALIPVTSSIVILLAGSDTITISSKSIFDIFISRLSEVSVGALSASLCSALIMPSKISDILDSHIKTVTIETIELLAYAFDVTVDSTTVRTKKQKALLLITQILDESRAAALEGDNRGANIIAQECLNLAISTHAILRLRRRADSAQLAFLNDISEILYEVGSKIKSGQPSEVARALALLPTNTQMSSLTRSRSGTEFVTNIKKIKFHLVYLLATERDALSPDFRKPKPSFVHDFIGNGVIGLRVATYVIASSAFWIMTGGTSSQIMMIIIPLLFSQLFANAPNPALAVKKLIIGSLIALPVGAFWALNFLSWGSGNIQILYLIFMSPLFIALMAMTHPLSAPYSIGFCFTYVLMVQPDNKMTFDFYNSLSLGMGVIMGLCILYTCIIILPMPNSRHIRHNALRLIKREAKKFSTGQTGADAFQCRSYGAILHMTKHSETGGNYRLALAGALEVHSRTLGGESSPPSTTSNIEN